MTTVRETTVRAGGFGTKLVEAGDPAKETLVLVHDGAFGTDAMLCWDRVIDALAHEYHLLAPDLLGWGGSDKVCYFDRSPYTFRLQHIGDLCETLMIDDPVVFVGVSFGAELVVRGTAEPRWGWPVRAAVALTGTGGRLFRVPGGVEKLSDYTPSLDAAARLTSHLVASDDGLGDHVARRFENSLTPGHWEALQAIRLQNPAVERVTPADDWPKPLESCTVPILFVEGQDDTLLEPGWADRMARIAPNGRAEVVPGAHEPNIDHPDEVAEVIRNFVAAL